MIFDPAKLIQLKRYIFDPASIASGSDSRFDCFLDHLGQKEKQKMNACKLLVTAAVISLVTLPALAQTTTSDDEKNGHHYSGGPKTVVPHHMGKKEDMELQSNPGGSHHYSGGPKTEVPHHIGPKKKGQ